MNSINKLSQNVNGMFTSHVHATTPLSLNLRTEMKTNYSDSSGKMNSEDDDFEPSC